MSCRIDLVFGVITALAVSSMVGCGEDSVSPSSSGSTQGYTRSASTSEQSQAQKATRFKVSDFGFLGFAFDVSVDGVPLGSTTSSNQPSNWAKEFSPGTHTLRVFAHSDAPARKSTASIIIYSGLHLPVSFVEPQAGAERCSFDYVRMNDEELVGLGKQVAYCEMKAGESVELEFTVR